MKPFLKGIFALLCLGLASGIPGRADTVVSIDMSKITFEGPCGSSLCQDVFNAAWQWDVTQSSIVPGTLTINNNGVLGADLQLIYYPPTIDYSFQFYDPWSDGIVWYFDQSRFPAPGVYPVDEVYLNCQSDACSSNFGPGWFYSQSGGSAVSSGEVTITQIPEPSSLALLGTVLLGLAGAVGIRRYSGH